MNEVMAAPESWPLIETDPDWELRQGPTFRVTTPGGSAVAATLLWSTDAGVGARITVDDEPITAELTLDQLTALDIASSSAVSVWRGLIEGNNA